jgi:hypothetical protein
MFLVINTCSLGNNTATDYANFMLHYRKPFDSIKKATIFIDMII